MVMAESKKEPFDYKSLKETLEDAIKSEKPNKEGIELDEDFFEYWSGNHKQSSTGEQRSGRQGRTNMGGR